MDIKTTFEKWQDNELDPQEAVTALAHQLDSLQDRLEPLQEMEKALRSQMSVIVEALGGKVQLPGFGKLENTTPSKLVSYDRKALDNLVIRLMQYSPEIAQDIANCRAESFRAGSFRITRERGKEGGSQE